MSNQRISSLPPLSATDVQPQDLFLIVDRDSYASSTGQSKNISAGDLTEYIKDNITSGNTVAQPIYQATHSLTIGQVVRLDVDSGTYVTASANSTTGKESEVAGIISHVEDVDNFTLIFAGIVDFGQNPSFAEDGLVPGVTYFLGDAGTLLDEDPSAGAYPSWISKPYLLGITATQGLITNYRGFYRPGNDEATIVGLYVTASNSFLVGDAVRKTQIFETASLGDWTLASADTYDFTEIVGLVSQASVNSFTLTLTGRLTGLSNLQIGETYYLVPSASINYSTSQSRNLLPEDSTSCSQFSKPVYIAISSTDAVILNHRAYPDKNAVSPCVTAQSYGPMCYPSPENPTTENVLALANMLLPNAQINETATIYWIQPVVQTFISPSNVVIWYLFKSEFGWEIGT